MIMANNATQDLAELAEVFKALGHPTRLWIVCSLAHGEKCVCDFVEGTGEEFSAVSQHLNVLKKARVVTSEKRGKHVFYKLVYSCIPGLTACRESAEKSCVCPVKNKFSLSGGCNRLSP